MKLENTKYLQQIKIRENTDTEIEITEITKDVYGVATRSFFLMGYYEKITDNRERVQLWKWYDRKTKRYKTEKNKLWRHTERYFDYIISEYFMN